MEANEILNNEELMNDVEVVESLPETNNVAVKVAIGVGVIVIAGVANMLYKKHKNKAEDGEDCKKRRFTLLKKDDEEQVDEVLDSEEAKEK